jgi:hypothetical protein
MKYVAWALLIVSGAVRADGLYIEGGLSAYRQNKPPKVSEDTYNFIDSITDGVPHQNSKTIMIVNYWRYDINHVRNPAGDLTIGYEKGFGRLALDLQIRHESFIPVHDRGRESLRLSLRWYLFR